MDNKPKRKIIPTAQIWSEYRSELMGIAIISVIMFHFIKDYRSFIDGDLPAYMSFLYTYIGSAGVDAFLFFSGIGLYYSFKDGMGRKGLLRFYLYRFSRLLVPYLIIAIPSIYLRRIVREGKDIMEFVRDLTFQNFITIGESWYWYIGMALICYLIFPIVYHMMEKASGWWSEIVMNLLLFAFVTLIARVMQVYTPELFGNINAAILRFPSFFIGVYVGKRAYQDRPLNILLFLLSGALIYCNVLIPEPDIVASRYLSALNFMAFLFVVCIVFHIGEIIPWHPIRAVLRFIGRYTMELYLTHVTVRYMMTWVGLRPTSYLLFALMLMICIAVSIVLNIISGFILKWLR